MNNEKKNQFPLHFRKYSTVTNTSTSRPIRCSKIKKNSSILTNILLVSSSILQLFVLLHFNEGTQKYAAIDQNAIPVPSTPTYHNKISVDILSIGSQTRLDYIHTQKSTFASHRSVRNFFSVTEDDDADPKCESKLTASDVAEISNFCRTKAKWNPKRQFLMTYLKSSYAREQFLLKKSNPQGWMCAQMRPTQGLYRVLETYKTKNESFPDFLIIMDDDTYYNMKIFEEIFSNLDSSDSHAVAGCRVRSPINKINWTFAFGGYGLVVSRGWLKRMLEPIVRPRDGHYCRFIRHTNHIGEREVFRSGMTLADLTYAYTLHQPFSEYRNWTTGFCLHSDWLLGYITNFYNVSRHVVDKEYENVPQARLEAYLQSEISASANWRGGRRLCDFLRGNCHSMAPVCHYSKPEEMTRITNIVRKQNPEQFKTIPNACVDCDKVSLGHSHDSKLIVDFFSFARNASDLLAQKAVVGSHELIRHFFSFTALDDNDPLCIGFKSDPSEVVKDCQYGTKGIAKNWFLAGLRSPHSRGKDSSLSWLCEQRRLVRAVSEVLGRYKMQDGAEGFPDYLILADSGSYWNMGVFGEMLRNIELEVQNGIDGLKGPSGPLVVGGCVGEYRVFKRGFFFRVPLMSHGIILNRGILDSLLQPLYCNATFKKDPRCHIMEESQVWERETFQQGMTPIDLIRMDLITRAVGICVEAEWLLSFFFQFYSGAKTSTLPLQSSLEPSESTVRTYLKSIMKRSGPEMLCRYRESNCNPDAPYCSSIPADQMLSYMKGASH